MIKIEEERFRELVRDFCSTYVSEYLTEYKIDFHLSGEGDEVEFAASIICDDLMRGDWIIPIKMSEYHDGEIAIDIGDCGEVQADNGGLYSFLWNTACSRLSELKYETERQEKYRKKDSEELVQLHQTFNKLAKLVKIAQEYDQFKYLVAVEGLLDDSAVQKALKEITK